LISKNTLCCRYGVFKVHAGRRPAQPRRTVTRRHGLSKLNSVRCAVADKRLLARDIATSRSTLFPGEPSHRTKLLERSDINEPRTREASACPRARRLQE
jgi:hypothetical protein